MGHKQKEVIDAGCLGKVFLVGAGEDAWSVEFIAYDPTDGAPEWHVGDLPDFGTALAKALRINEETGHRIFFSPLDGP